MIAQSKTYLSSSPHNAAFFNLIGFLPQPRNFKCKIYFNAVHISTTDVSIPEPCFGYFTHLPPFWRWNAREPNFVKGNRGENLYHANMSHFWTNCDTKAWVRLSVRSGGKKLNTYCCFISDVNVHVLCPFRSFKQNKFGNWTSTISKSVWWGYINGSEPKMA